MVPVFAAIPITSVAIPVLIVVVLLVGLVVAWMWVRRFFFSDGGLTSQQAWDLEELRRMHESGHLSKDEYEHLRQVAKTTLVSGYEPRQRSGVRGGRDGSDPILGAVLLDSMVHDEDSTGQEPSADHSNDGGGFDSSCSDGGGDSGGGDSG